MSAVVLRKLLRALLGLTILFAGALGFFSLRASTIHYPLAKKATGNLEIRGAYHVHSSASDGRGTVDEIAAAAGRAGLDFVIFTDHNLEEIPVPRIVGGVALVFGVEESTPTGHVVALGVDRGLTTRER